MKVLFVSRSAQLGGAAIAMQRLAASLRARSVEVEVATAEDGADGRFAVGAAERLLGRVLWQAGLDHVHTRGSFRLASAGALDGFDVVHLHNLHSGFFNYLALPRLARRIPVVWTLHDMWAMTGHCGYSLECERWKSGCGSCPHLHAYPYMERDASHLEWRLKRWSYRRSRLQVAAPSRWLAGLAGQGILGAQPIHHVPYGLDLQSWRPQDRAQARARFGIPADAFVLLAMADQLDEERKGGRLLAAILQRLSPALRTRCILLSAGRGSAPQVAGLRAIHAGHLQADMDKMLLYSAADLTLFGSMADNLPLVLMETMACAVPAVAFGVGGIPDLVEDGRTGVLVEAFDEAAYACQIEALAAEPGRMAALGAAARRHMEAHFHGGLEAAAYLEIYRQAVAGHTQP